MRGAAGALGVASVALGTFLAAHHVLSPPLAVALFLAWSAAVFWRPWWWLVGVPASLPLIAFAPRTGVLITEEWDLVVLGAAAGAYLAHAVRPAPPALRDAVEGARVSPGWWAVMGLFVISALVALWRGVADAGPVDLAWTQGYYDTLNSVRVEKGLALALLLVPLLRSELATAGVRTVVRIAAGFALAGAVAAAWVVWERAAFPGVLNFSTDYRVTGPFWEMHVGGAALDGFLALTLPFTIFALLRARRALALAAALVGVGLVLYAALVTFSRGVYLALPASLVVLALLLRMRPDSGHPPLTLAGAASAVGFGVGAAAASFLAFHAGGYRGLGAALGAFALALPAFELARGTRARDWLLAAVLGVVAAIVATGVAALLPKGTYALYAVAAGACGGLLWRVHRGSVALRPLALATLCWLIAMAIAVPVSWAGEGALEGALAAVTLFVALALWMARAPFAARRARWQVQILTVGAATLLAAVVAVFTGGAYMADRFATGSTDLDERIHQWRDGLAMLNGPADWLLGKGAGRFPANYLFQVRDSVFPGSYRLAAEGGKTYLTLSGPRYPTSFVDLFRVSQRVAARPGAYVLTLSARAADSVRLHVEICEKHLLYCEGLRHRAAGRPGRARNLAAPDHPVGKGRDGRPLVRA